MEITYSTKEVEEIILKQARSIYPEANYVSVKVSGYSTMTGATVSFVEPEPEKVET